MYSNYMNTDNQIQYMDYPGLVQLLTTAISPETRAVVLTRLTQMNNQLLNQMQTQFQTQFQTQLDLSRPVSVNSRKKDATELQHPSMEQIPRQSNSVPRSARPTPKQAPIRRDPESDSELDIDDILRDINGPTTEPDLDQKLKQLTNLKQKILNDKRHRKTDQSHRQYK